MSSFRARSRTGSHGRVLTCLVAALAVVAVLLPLSSTAQALPVQGVAQQSLAQRATTLHPAAITTRATSKKAKKARAKARRAQARARAKARARAHAHALAVARHRAAVRRANGTPPGHYAIPTGSYFSFPNRSRAEQQAIRNRVLLTIRSVWGGPRGSLGTPQPYNGKIRITTWSFDDWAVARALVAARNRGVSVQVMAAQTANGDHGAWHWLRKRLGTNLYKPGHPITRDTYSFARQCRGSCRGYGGTAHAKYFLFDRVGSHRLRHIVVNTSMNMTSMAYQGQWNQAQVVHSTKVYYDFLKVFRQTRVGRAVSRPYHVAKIGSLVDYFFPRPNANHVNDPVMQVLSPVNCRGATLGGTRRGQTRIRIIQYAMYGDRGVWIAKRLRYLWNRGCDIGIIYSVSSRPVLSILRNGSGRGPVPMRQSVVKDYWGNIVKYNHSKWMTITGHWGSSTGAFVTFTGSANWARLAFGSDEQMQSVIGRANALRYGAAFGKTWRQGSSRPPSFGRSIPGGRLLPAADVPEDAPTFGRGVFRHMTQD